VWVVHRKNGEEAASVELARVKVNGYRNDDVLVSGLPAGTIVVTAGVQKMAPGLKVALPGTAAASATTDNEVAAR
jgi:hypothetical protein